MVPSYDRWTYFCDKRRTTEWYVKQARTVIHTLESGEALSCHSQCNFVIQDARCVIALLLVFKNNCNYIMVKKKHRPTETIAA